MPVKQSGFRNCASLLGWTAGALLQQPLQVLAGATTTELIRRALEADDLEDANPLLLEINAQRFNGSLSRHGHYVPVPIVPLLRPDTGQPLDLGFSVLRSVLPVHCQYLENMGVRAAMSLSLLEDDQLWGLITCAHPEPLLVIHTKATRMVAAWFCISVAASCRPTVVSFGRKANPEREACLPFPSPHWQRRSGSSL